MGGSAPTLYVTASEMRGALKTVVGRRKTAVLARLSPKPSSGSLLIAEYRYKRGVAEEIPVSGTWYDVPVVDAQHMHRVFRTYADDALVELVRDGDGLVIRNGRSKVQMPVRHTEELLLDEEAIPSDTRHAGPVEMPAEPQEKRVELDHTWLFSARMPVPQHRHEKPDRSSEEGVDQGSGQKQPQKEGGGSQPCEEAGKFAVELRKIREHYDIRQAEMARRLGWDVQRYRRYEDPSESAGKHPRTDALDEIWDTLKVAGASVDELIQLLPPYLRGELLDILQSKEEAEKRLDKIRSAISGGGSK